MDCRDNDSMLPVNPVTQIAGMPYSLYLSLQGKYFSGYTKNLKFGEYHNAWAGLFNPKNSGVNLHLYYWEVANTGVNPVRARIYFNTDPSGSGSKVSSVFQPNTALFPPPKPKVAMCQASRVEQEPSGGVRVFVRRIQPGLTVGDEEVGKFIFPPGGNFLIFLSDPETPADPANAVLGFSWWEEPCEP